MVCIFICPVSNSVSFSAWWSCQYRQKQQIIQKDIKGKHHWFYNKQKKKIDLIINGMPARGGGGNSQWRSGIHVCPPFIGKMANS